MGTKVRFRFWDDHLDYSVREAGRGVDLPIKYESVATTESYTQVGRSGQFIRYVVPTVMITFILLNVIRVTVGENTVLLWAALLAIFAACAFLVVKYRSLTSVHATMFKLSANPAGLHSLSVLKDKDHDEIIVELKKRWRARLRKLHLQVNPTKDPKSEIEKFKWLRDHDVISHNEFDVIVQRIGPVAPGAFGQLDSPVSVN